jgi:hypothetical protein
MRGSARDASKHCGRLSFESWATSPPNVSQEGLQLTPQLLSDWRLRLMLVDDAAACRFEARSQGRRSVCDVGIDHTRDVAWLEAKKPCLDQEKELELPLGHLAKRRDQDGQIALLLSLGRRGGMPLGGFQIDTICRTGNFSHPLCRAANRTNVVAQRGTGATSLTGATEGAGHKEIVGLVGRVGPGGSLVG